MSAESSVGAGMMSGFSGSTSTSPSWWDTNGGNTIAGIGATVGSIFQALPGLIAAGQGADVVYAPSPNPTQTGPQYAQQPPAQSNSSTLVWIVVIVVLVILLIAAGIYFSKSSAK